MVRRAAIVFRSTASSLTSTRHSLRIAAAAKQQRGYKRAGRVCERTDLQLDILYFLNEKRLFFFIILNIPLK
jgi:hypothetical protein